MPCPNERAPLNSQVGGRERRIIDVLPINLLDPPGDTSPPWQRCVFKRRRTVCSRFRSGRIYGLLTETEVYCAKANRQQWPPFALQSRAATQRQTTVTAHFSSKQLLMFVFALTCWFSACKPWERDDYAGSCMAAPVSNRISEQSTVNWFCFLPVKLFVIMLSHCVVFVICYYVSKNSDGQFATMRRQRTVLGDYTQEINVALSF